MVNFFKWVTETRNRFSLVSLPARTKDGPSPDFNRIANSHVSFPADLMNRHPIVEKPKTVQLMMTCLCDAFFDDVARATHEVLESLGIEVIVPESQTCCGQPAFNGGDWASARQVIRHTLNVFQGDCPIIVPSGSCAAMSFHGALLAHEKEPDLPQVQAFGARTWEICDFLRNGLGIDSWEGRLDARVAIHSSCHSRGTGTPEAIRTLVGSIAGVTLLDFTQPEQCCGFGGTFSVTFPHISGSMGRLKIDSVRATNPDLLVSGDMSCLMHLNGLAEKQGSPLPVKHAIQVLRDARVTPVTVQ